MRSTPQDHELINLYPIMLTCGKNNLQVMVRALASAEEHRQQPLALLSKPATLSKPFKAYKAFDVGNAFDNSDACSKRLPCRQRPGACKVCSSCETLTKLYHAGLLTHIIYIQYT